MPDALDQLVDQVFAAAQTKRPLVIRAGGTKDFYGNACGGERLDPRGYAGIVSYEPTELVLTARCGTPLAELEAALADQGQMLGFEPPHFGTGATAATTTGATFGGMLAAGLSGPRRAATIGGGSVRDFVLGAKLLSARGEVLSFGGQVMKNVAGYDVSRLLVGSLGTLGLILEASVKVVPRPVAERTIRLAANESAAIKLVNTWAGQPWPISATVWHDGVLQARLSGSEAGVREGAAALGGEFTDEVPWVAVREHTHPFFAGAAPLWRVSVPSTTPPLELGATLIEWGGALRWVRGELPAAKVRERARAAGGHATLFRGGDRSAGAFQPLDPVLDKIHRRLKAEFDPHGIFNRGRMYAEF